jgi:hypothetical protein
MAWAGQAKDAAQNYLRDLMWPTWQDGIFLQAFSGHGNIRSKSEYTKLMLTR